MKGTLIILFISMVTIGCEATYQIQKEDLVKRLTSIQKKAEIKNFNPKVGSKIKTSIPHEDRLLYKNTRDSSLQYPINNIDKIAATDNLKKKWLVNIGGWTYLNFSVDSTKPKISVKLPIIKQDTVYGIDLKDELKAIPFEDIKVITVTFNGFAQRIPKSEYINIDSLVSLLAFQKGMQKCDSIEKESFVIQVLRKGNFFEKNAEGNLDFSKNGFYMIRDVAYDFVIDGRMYYQSVLKEITKDSIFFTNHFNENVAKRKNEKFEIIGKPINTIDQLRLTKNDNFSFVRVKNGEYEFKSVKIKTKYSSMCVEKEIYQDRIVDIYLHLQAQRYMPIYEYDGCTVMY